MPTVTVTFEVDSEYLATALEAVLDVATVYVATPSLEDAEAV